MDILTGGAGSDRFKLLSASTANRDIILDFENAMRAFASAFDYDVSPGEIEELRVLGGYNKKQEGENLKSHTRKKLPGDHKEKLKPETIAYLDELFAPELNRFGYMSEALSDS